MSQKDTKGLVFALRERCAWSNLWVSVALVACGGLLVAALSQPILHMQQMLFWKQTYTVWTGIVDLWRLGEYLLATIVFLFSMVFPFAKLFILIYVWYVKISIERREKLLRWLDIFGKWSMLDVYVVAILVVLVKVGSIARIEPRIGIYLFTAAIIASMLTTGHVERVAKRASFNALGNK